METGDRAFSPETPPTPRGNGMGVAGFVISLVGLVLTCCVLCPLGLIFSLVGLGKQPRGLAIAGAVIGGLGTLLLVLGLVFGIGYGKTMIGVVEAAAKIESYKQEHHEYPDDAEAERLLGDLKDGWDRPFRYSRSGTQYHLSSAGPDGVFGSADDIAK